MGRLRKSANILVSLALFVSSSGVSAPPFANGSSSVGTAAERISKSADALAKKKLSAYVLSRYANAPVPTRERFAANFASVESSESDRGNPSHLPSPARKKIVAAPSIKEDGALFWAYAHILLSLRDSKSDVEKMAEERKAELKTALKEATLGKIKPKTAAEKTEMLETFRTLGFDPWSSSDLSKMRKTAEELNVSPKTRYFKAYAFARAELATGGGNLSLLRAIPHEKQIWSLSCEANSMRDVVNYYRIGEWLPAADESNFVFLLPTDPTLPKYENGIRIWADPTKTFVGRIDGKQSANPQKLTGYGIHADGILPYLRRELKLYGMKAEKRGFDSDSIRNSLAAWHPVFFWYVIGGDSAAGFSRLDWKTKDGNPVTGFVGEHVGVVVWAKLDNNGKIEEISYLEGRSGQIQKESFDSLSRKAKWFNEAIYVSEAEKIPAKSSPGNGGVRKKNLKSAVRKTSGA